MCNSFKTPKKTKKPEKKTAVVPAKHDDNNTPSSNATVAPAPQEQSKTVQALPVATAQPSNTSSDNTDTGALPQTGNAKSNIFVELIGLGFVAIPAMAFVDYIRRHQTSGID